MFAIKDVNFVELGSRDVVRHRLVGDDAKYNAIAASVMAKHKIPTDDLFALTKGFAGKHSKAAGDVHYTPEGSEKLAAQVADTIEKVLPNK